MKTYVEVAVTIYKTVLVEVSHERTAEEETIYNLAQDAARDEYSADEAEITGVFYDKPSKNNMAIYDDFLETNE
jgi:hypothetical protein